MKLWNFNSSCVIIPLCRQTAQKLDIRLFINNTFTHFTREKNKWHPFSERVDPPQTYCTQIWKVSDDYWKFSDTPFIKH